VFVSRLTAPLIEWEDLESPLRSSSFRPARDGWSATSRSRASPFPHDAVDPVGFCFHAEGVKIGVATDLGYVPDSIKIHLRRVQILLLESNHDLEMLKVGPYPWSVKQRVMGRNGHLSNAHTCDYLENDLDGGVQTLILGHLSEQNNHPGDRPHGRCAIAVTQRGLAPRLVIAEQKNPTEVFAY
jgi:hypothetical protein